jgi:hypothetical protein
MTTSTKLSTSVNAKCFKSSPTCTALEALLLPKLRYDRGGGGTTVPAYLQDIQCTVVGLENSFSKKPLRLKSDQLMFSSAFYSSDAHFCRPLSSPNIFITGPSALLICALSLSNIKIHLGQIKLSLRNV